MATTFNFGGANIQNVNIYLFGGDYDDLMDGEFANLDDLTEEDLKVQKLLQKCALKGSHRKKHRKNIGRDKSFDERSDIDRNEESEE
jgi:hypothetical protein